MLYLPTGTHAIDCENVDLNLRARFSATILPEETISMLDLPLERPSPQANPGMVQDWQRHNAAMRAFSGSRIINGCWQHLLRLDPSVRGRAVQVLFSVDVQGRFTLNSVQDSPDPRFDGCIRDRLGLITPLGEGAPMSLVQGVRLSIAN